MENYNNGHVVDVSKISVSDFEKAAKEWSEGSKTLEELLLYCLKNNIITQACCIGHKDTDMAFLQFELSERNIKEIIKIINRYYNLNGVNMTFVNQPGIISKFDIRVPKNMGEQFFRDMLMQLSNGLDIGFDSLTTDMQTTIAAMTGHRVPNDYLEVQYSFNNKKELFVATTNPNYSELYWDKDEAKPWVENSVGISGTPESIEPIIREISKKTSLEYSNYVEIQRRHNVQQTTNPSSTSVPQEISEKEIVPIVANVQATRENDYARNNSMTIVEVLPGMSIEDVAKTMCGQRYICKFNNFEIDGSKYTSSEQIVEAYKKDWEEGKKRLLESRKKQEQIDNLTRQQQIASMTNNKELTSDVELEEGGLKR